MTTTATRPQSHQLGLQLAPPTIIGIDPGAYGAMAAVAPDGAVTIADCPLLLTKIRKRRGKPPIKSYSLDYAGVVDLIRPYAGQAIAIIEDVTAFGMGRASAFKFGGNVAAWCTACAAFDVPVRMIMPSAWKPAIGLSDDKGRSLALARELFPSVADMLRRKKDHDRAEALLLVHWYRSQVSD